MSRVNIIRATALAAALSVGLGTTASAQGPIIGGGLVNVQLVRVIDDVEVNVTDISIPVTAAVNLAANVCGVAVGVLAADLAEDGTAFCSAVVDGRGPEVTITQ